MMTAKEFLNRVAKAREDFLQAFLDMLAQNNVPFCAVGGLAVNAYAEPVVSLDLDVVILVERLDDLVKVLREGYSVTEFPNSLNVTYSKSDLRIQIQTDERYQPFISRATVKKVLGYEMSVAAIEDVLQGKIWAAMDETRRPSKRQKDYADIMRLVEARQDLIELIPESLKNRLFPKA